MSVLSPSTFLCNTFTFKSIKQASVGVSALLISARFVTRKLRDRFVRRILIPQRLVICHKCRAKSLSKSRQKCPIRLATQKFLVGIRQTRLTARNQFSSLSNLRKHLQKFIKMFNTQDYSNINQVTLQNTSIIVCWKNYVLPDISSSFHVVLDDFGRKPLRMKGPVDTQFL